MFQPEAVASQPHQPWIATGARARVRVWACTDPLLFSVDYFVILSLQTTDDPAASALISRNPDASTGEPCTTLLFFLSPSRAVFSLRESLHAAGFI
jgi:hypothetical protein